MSTEEAQAPEQPEDEGFRQPAIAGALDRRYQVLASTPLEEFTTPSAQAFAARDKATQTDNLCALLCTQDLPVRDAVMTSLRRGKFNNIMRPVGWGTIDWPPIKRRALAIICERPLGKRIMSPGSDKAKPVPTKRVMENIARPLFRLILKLGRAGISVRAIRPDNLYYLTDTNTISLGQFFCGPPGIDQPSIFEPLERALAHPCGRGEGGAADDAYAAGVAITFLALGHNPLAGKDARWVLDSRLQRGSYSTVIGPNPVPSELSDLLRQLLRDDPRERWGLGEIERWLDGQRHGGVRQTNVGRAEWSFEFNGTSFDHPWPLADAMHRNWDAALPQVRSRNLKRWVDLGLRDVARGERLLDARRADASGPRRVNEDLALARQLAVLQPAAPLRFRGVSVMPDGLGPYVAATCGDPNITRAFADMIQGGLPDFWRQQQVSMRRGVKIGGRDVARIARFTNQGASGFYIERCVYELNPSMHCLSEHLVGYRVSKPAELLEALEAIADDGRMVWDRHIAAFTAARLKSNVDRMLNVMAAAKTPARAVMARLAFLAQAQDESGPESVPHLTGLFYRQLKVVFDSYRNMKLRERLGSAAKKAVNRGRLRALVDIADNPANRQWDAHGFRVAMSRYADIEREIDRLEKSVTSRPRHANELGSRAAAYVAGSISAISILVVLVLGLPG